MATRAAWARSAAMRLAVLVLAVGSAGGFEHGPPAVGAAPAAQSAVNLGSSKDNTLYENATGATSNGAGQHMFAGDSGSGGRRRGVIAFDAAGTLPAGSTIESVSLTLNMSNRSGVNPGPQSVQLRRLLEDWGEGTSDAGLPGGQGAPATTNDATWLHRFFNAQTWSTAGGLFSSTASAITTVDTVQQYTWTSAQMVADVQGWLDNPTTNFGWLLLGNESEDRSARRFDTKENATAANRPVLNVQYAPAALAAPATPTNSVATAGDRQVVLDWDDNTEADLEGYNVYRSITQGGPYSAVNPSLVTSSAFTDTAVTAGIAYFYVITAVNTGGGESLESGESVATPFDAVPAPPTNLVANAGDRQLILDWDDGADPDLAGYNVYRSTPQGAGQTRINSALVIASAFTDAAVVSGVAYFYVVRAVDLGGNESADSTEATATPFDAAPAAPTGLAPTAGDRQAFLDWADNAEADLAGYNVYRSTAQGSGHTRINPSPVTASAYLDNTVVANTTYYYVVRAVDLSGNESANSDEISAIPFDLPADVPEDLVALGGQGLVSLDWSDVAALDLAGYRVYRGPNPMGAKVLLTSSPVVASEYLDTGLADNVTFYYTVTSIDAGGNESGPSVQTSATTTPGPTPISALSRAGVLALVLAVGGTIVITGMLFPRSAFRWRLS